METSDLKTGELTVIASEVKVTGSVQVRHELHLYGQIHGEIKGLAGSLIHLKEGSLFEGKIMAETVIVDGFVKGEIHCSQRVWVSPQGRVVGSVHAPSLQVDPGAIFEARVQMN